MNTMSDVHLHSGDAESPGPSRFLQRQGRRQAKLRRWESSLAQRLVPAGRPLYTCQHCGFANIYGEICLWCGHRCLPMGASRLKRRRASSPHLLSDVQKEQLLGMQQRVAALYVPQEKRGAPAGQEKVREGKQSGESRTVRRRRHRDAAVFSVGDVAAAGGVNAEARFLVQSIIGDHPLTPPLPDTLPLPKEEKAIKPAKLPPASSSPARTLRRRKRFSLSKRPSCCSLKSMFTDSLNNLPSNASCVSEPIGKPTAPRTRMLSAPTTPLRSVRSGPLVPLGHPSRPLYTAIRKNMHWASSPYSTPPESPTKSTFSDARVVRSVASLDFEHPLTEEEEEEALHESLTAFSSRYISKVTNGCSLSGEAELRIALSRHRNPERNDSIESGSSSKTKVDASKDKPSLKVVCTLGRKFGRGLRDLLVPRRS